MGNNPTPSGDVFCVSCQTPIQGAYCHQCGEKQIDPKHDFNLFYFLRETLEQYLNFDAKVLRSLKLFFIQPGGLTLAWIQGQRKAYMKPLTLFLTVAVAVHFFLPTTNVYFELLDELVSGYNNGNRLQNVLGYNMTQAIQQKSQALNITPSAFYTLAFKNCWENSKLFLIAIPPFWAFFIWGLYYAQNRYYLPHLIFALHGFGFFMALDLLFLLIMSDLLKFEAIDDLWFLPLFIGYGVYLWRSLRKVYGNISWPLQALKFLGTLISLIFSIILYRQIITVLTVVGM